MSNQVNYFPGRFEGKTAVVTGGASGIGLGIVRRLLAEGACVVAGDLAVGTLEELELEFGPKFRGIATNVTSEADVSAMVDAAIETFGGLHVAFNAAGVGEGEAIHEQGLDLWNRQLSVLLTGVFLAVKHESQRMIQCDVPGAIVNISSINGVVPSRGGSAYCTSKAGVEMLTRTAALDLAPHGVRVCAVAPGLVNTPMAARTGHMKPAIVEKWMEHTPLGRVGETADIAAAALFLASDEASWITGTVLTVDGGLVNTAYPHVSTILE